jgi:DNA repair protein RadC
MYIVGLRVELSHYRTWRNQDKGNIMQAQSEVTASYTVNVDRSIVAQALAFLDNEMRKDGVIFESPQVVRNFLICHNGLPADQNIERFAVLFLDSQHRMIECETLSTGTLTQTSVYPREVVRAALRHNAAAVILSHNHPSGNLQPSRADESLTQTLKSALALIDVRVLDHIITSCGQAKSMAEMGLM